MLLNAETIRGRKLGASDGEIGKITDLYFDDATWTVRYFVVQTGKWLQDRRVLVTPRRISGFDPERGIVDVNLTRTEVEASPPEESDRPVAECVDIFWLRGQFWPAPYELEKCDEGLDVRLRSMESVQGYSVAASDGDMGHVDGFIIDDTDWAVRYLVVDTGMLWAGKHVLMSPEWIEDIDWKTTKVHVALSQGAIKESPEFDPDSPVDREYEAELCRFYNREGYWTRTGCPEDEPPEDEPPR